MKWSIPIISFILACLSLTTLHSIAPELVFRQFFYFVIGFILFFLLRYLKFKQLEKPSTVLFWLLNLVLLLLLIIGQSTRATVRWIDLFAGFKLQPSQYASLLTALHLSFILPKIKTKTIQGLANLIFLIILPVLLIFLQPDFSTSLMLAVSLSTILFFTPVKIKHLAMFGLFSMIVVIVSWNSVLKPYQKNRVISFFSSSETQETDADYNARQALIAVGSGQMFGRGLGFGVQSHLKFLPERQTDFVFASIAEEWGFVGSALLVCLFFSLILVMWSYCIKMKDKRHRFFILVVIANIFFHVMINIGMNVGLMPITGLTLPLVSYGGSSIIAFMISFGIVFNLIEHQAPALKLRIN